MQYALDQNGIKRKPQKEIEAICPLCKGKVIAACGNINVHHWRHKDNEECDTWHEPETEWHINWKDKFPKEWREYCINRSGKRHFADVRTDHGLIIEFQNSTIDSETIIEREEFYLNMIWVVNTVPFYENISILSSVKYYLRKYNHELIFERGRLQFKYETKSRNRDNEKQNIKNKLLGNEDEINRNKDHVLKVKELNLKEVLQKNNIHFYDFYDTGIKVLIKLDEEIVENQKILTEQNKKIFRINNFKQFKHDGYEKYKIVEFDLVSKENFLSCKVIGSDYSQNLFPDVLDLNSEYDFIYYHQNKDLYLLIMDFSIIIEKSELKMKESNILIDKLNKNFNTIYSELAEKFENWKNSEIIAYQAKTKTLQNKEKKLKKEQREYDKNHSLNTINTEILNLEKRRKEEENNIKRKYKGIYHFKWRHKRKTWNYAMKPIFLDYNDHVFQLIGNNEVRKITKIDFINSIMDGKNIFVRIDLT